MCSYCSAVVSVFVLCLHVFGHALICAPASPLGEDAAFAPRSFAGISRQSSSPANCTLVFSAALGIW
eukprot:8859832-Pyramimonas_sp.AAC.1